MSFLKNIFGKSKKQETNTTSGEDLPWIEPSQNPWGFQLLDLRPISQTMLSTSKDLQMATNAISYRGEDGTGFWGLKPNNNKAIATIFSIPIFGSLEPGVLFTPNTIEHKWAIYFDGEFLIFVRSCTRQSWYRLTFGKRH